MSSIVLDKITTVLQIHLWILVAWQKIYTVIYHNEELMRNTHSSKWL